MRGYVECLVLLVCCSAGAQTAPTSAVAMAKTAPGTELPLIIVRPLLRKKAAVHDAVYAETLAPVVRNHQVLIPAGTQLQGEVEAITQPGFFRPHATLTIHFPQAVLNGNYVVDLDDELSGAREAAQLTVGVTLSNQFFLDTGTTFDLPLRTSLTIDLARLPASSASPGPLASSSTCRPTEGFPGSPGTPDVVIPGMPGTPDTVIPGVNGGAPTIIPGTPATPPTVIAGMPGTPGTPGNICPAAPRVTAVVLVP